MDDHAQEDALIAQFAGVASVPASEARQYLATNNWDLPAALTEFYTAQEEQPEQEQDDNDADCEDEDEAPQVPIVPGGGRRLGDASTDPQPVPSTTSGPSQVKKPPQKSYATLGDLSSGSGHGHDHDDEDDDDDKPTDLFTGGEKSGLAVQNPDDLKKKILEKAMKTGKPPPKEEAKPRSSHFTGTARTLGDDNTESQVIEPPSATQAPRRGERVDRVLHFWNDGFSVDDGDLYRTDDPRNAEILNGIRQGRAPLSIMNVQPGQEVDVEIKQHQEDYVRPKKKYVPFGGQGNRLGSPTPGGLSQTMPGSFTEDVAPPPQASTTEPAKPQIDEAQPTVNLQIRLGSGTRLPARFNTTQTIGDVYTFVNAASPESASRAWVLQTTFPPTELTDKSKVLGDMPDFKRGGVVVQKWK